MKRKLSAPTISIASKDSLSPSPFTSASPSSAASAAKQLLGKCVSKNSSVVITPSSSLSSLLESRDGDVSSSEFSPDENCQVEQQKRDEEKYDDNLRSHRKKKVKTAAVSAKTKEKTAAVSADIPSKSMTTSVIFSPPSAAPPTFLKCLKVCCRAVDYIVRGVGGDGLTNREDMQKILKGGRCFLRSSFNAVSKSGEEVPPRPPHSAAGKLRKHPKSPLPPPPPQNSIRSSPFFPLHFSTVTEEEEMVPKTLSVIKDLKEYQRVGVQWLLALHEEGNVNGVLADEMGLGKTAQTCVFLNFLYEMGLSVASSIIVVPASLLDNWLIELERWAPSIRAVKLHGESAKERRKILIDVVTLSAKYSTETQVLVTTAQTLANPDDQDLIRRGIGVLNYLIVDEAHSLKNADTIACKTMRDTTNLRPKRRLFLSGSPIQNRTDELLTFVGLLMPKAFPESSLRLAMEEYCECPSVCNPLTEVVCLNSSSSSSFVPASTMSSSSSSLLPISSYCITSSLSLLQAAEEASKKQASAAAAAAISADIECLQLLLSPFILRRLKDEVLDDLPSKTTKIVRCTMTNDQRRLYSTDLLTRKSELSHYLKNLASSQKNASVDFATSTLTKNKDKHRSNSDDQQKYQEKDDEDEVEGMSVVADKKMLYGGRGGAGSNRFAVKSMLAKLRRICNHPLMVQGYYHSDETIERLIDYMSSKDSDYSDVPRIKIEELVSSWSDFDIHSYASEISELTWARVPESTFLESGKILEMLKLLKSICGEKKEKVLIFSQYTQHLNLLESVLSFHYSDLQYLRLDGSTHISERQGLVNQFNSDKKISVFLLSTKAGGQGLNLTGAANVILMDQDWNPHNDRQAEDRIHRLGSPLNE